MPGPQLTMALRNIQTKSITAIGESVGLAQENKKRNHAYPIWMPIAPLALRESISAMTNVSLALKTKIDYCICT